MSDKSFVMVTGAAGFVGANIARYLAQRKRDVFAVDMVPKDALLDEYFGGLENYVEWSQIDLTDFDKLLEIACNYRIDGIIHAAVFTGVTQDVEQAKSREILESNIMGTVNTLELAMRKKVRRYVYVSSGGVYGAVPNPMEAIREDSGQPWLHVNRFYKLTKLIGEKLTETYSQLFSMSATSMRIATPYGCMERPTRTRNVMGPIFSVLKLILTDGKKLIRVKDLGFAKDWTYVMDIADGIVRGLDFEGPLKPLYNISCGKMHSLEEILVAVRESSGQHFEWVEAHDDQADLSPPSGSLMGPLSIERARNELGFSPRYDLRRGIREYCNWWKEVTEKKLWRGS
jgi:UDP-glucuronate 4-epimerase